MFSIISFCGLSLFANAFIYFVRYGVLDWAPMYLEQVKHMDLANSSWSYFAFEIAGIFGTILCGWLSDKVFKGRRGPVTIIYMLLVMLAVYIYWNSASAMVTNVAMAAIGFLIYGPVMLIGVSALDLVPKKAAGTAAGFHGVVRLFAGIGRVCQYRYGIYFRAFRLGRGLYSVAIRLCRNCCINVVL